MVSPDCAMLHPSDHSARSSSASRSDPSCRPNVRNSSSVGAPRAREVAARRSEILKGNRAAEVGIAVERDLDQSGRVVDRSVGKRRGGWSAKEEGLALPQVLRSLAVAGEGFEPSTSGL